jgi:hypothetical protein
LVEREELEREYGKRVWKESMGREEGFEKLRVLL